MSGCAHRLGAMIYGLGCAGAAVMGALALWTALAGSGEERFWSTGFLAAGAAVAWLAGHTVRRFFATRTMD